MSDAIIFIFLFFYRCFYHCPFPFCISFFKLTTFKDVNSTTVDNNAMTTMAHETIIELKQRVPVKSIRVERDYSLGDGITRFQTEYPAELAGKVKKNNDNPL